MLTVVLILFVALVLYYSMKGELQYVRDSLEIQLRQARFRIDRLERRVRELEDLRGPEADQAQSVSEPAVGAS